MAIDVYLQIEGIKGESADERHKDWIDAVLIADDLEAGARTAAKRDDDHRSGLRR